MHFRRIYAEFFFSLKKTGNKLLKSVGFTKIGSELAIWHLLEVGTNLTTFRYFGQNHTFQTFRQIFFAIFSKFTQLPTNAIAKSRALCRFYKFRRILKVWNFLFQRINKNYFFADFWQIYSTWKYLKITKTLKINFRNLYIFWAPNGPDFNFIGMVWPNGHPAA